MSCHAPFFEILSTQSSDFLAPKKKEKFSVFENFNRLSRLKSEFPSFQRVRGKVCTGWGGRIRTLDGDTKNRCLATWLHPIM
jgi:hypothetical protein